jgi:hypothetical protein
MSLQRLELDAVHFGRIVQPRGNPFTQQHLTASLTHSGQRSLLDTAVCYVR